MKIIAFLILTMAVTSVKGQEVFDKKLHVGAGINSGVTVGIFSSVYSFTFGGNLKAELPVSQKFLLTFNAGYSRFLEKEGGEGVGFFPILGGFKYHFVPKVFIAAQGGIAIPTFRINGIVYSFSPGAGYNITKNLQIIASYNAYGEYGFVLGNAGIELAYYF